MYTHTHIHRDYKENYKCGRVCIHTHIHTHIRYILRLWMVVGRRKVSWVTFNDGFFSSMCKASK